MKGILEGLSFILIGIFSLYIVTKWPSKKGGILLPDLSLTLAGLLLIIVGISILIGGIPPPL